MTTATGAMGFEGIAINVWLIWMLPFIGAALIPALRRSKPKLLNYTAVGFSLVSAVLAGTLIPLALSDSEVHSQVNWISALNLDAGILADPLAIIMTNVVSWISFLILCTLLATCMENEISQDIGSLCCSLLDRCN